MNLLHCSLRDVVLIVSCTGCRQGQRRTMPESCRDKGQLVKLLFTEKRFIVVRIRGLCSLRDFVLIVSCTACRQGQSRNHDEPVSSRPRTVCLNVPQGRDLDGLVT